jgi:hypothetical protein
MKNDEYYRRLSSAIREAQDWAGSMEPEAAEEYRRELFDLQHEVNCRRVAETPTPPSTPEQRFVAELSAAIAWHQTVHGRSEGAIATSILSDVRMAFGKAYGLKV